MQSEQVHFPVLGVVNRKLDARYDAQSRTGRESRDFGDGSNRVMIGDSNGRQPCQLSRSEKLGRRRGPVRRGRVGVEVDGSEFSERPHRFTHCAYPPSGDISLD